jgi:hypothetical protein
MKKNVRVLFVALCLIGFSLPSYSQGGNGRGACMAKYYISYYKIEPGKYDEWLSLFKRWHVPIMKHDMDLDLFDFKFFGAGSHAVDPDWDFAAMYIEPAAPKKAPLTRSQIIHKLFDKNMDEYIAGEKRRWELTVEHWDQKMIQMDPLQEPFSVFLPIDDTCE